MATSPPRTEILRTLGGSFRLEAHQQLRQLRTSVLTINTVFNKK